MAEKPTRRVTITLRLYEDPDLPRSESTIRRWFEESLRESLDLEPGETLDDVVFPDDDLTDDDIIPMD